MCGGTEFQSTPSTRRETKRNFTFEIRAEISIHSLHTEGDSLCLPQIWQTGHFNPLPPHGGRRRRNSRPTSTMCISIHSLRMEGDGISIDGATGSAAFQSTPSAWRETKNIPTRAPSKTFQSTPSAWRETMRRSKLL